MDPFVPSSALSESEYYQQWNKIHPLEGVARSLTSANSFWNNIFNHSQQQEFKDAYQAYLANLNNQNSAAQQKWLLDYQKELQDTQYQRLTKDLQAAGLNPWLALQGGASAASSTSGATSSVDYLSASRNKKSKTGDNVAGLLGTALKVLALFALKG